MSKNIEKQISWKKEHYKSNEKVNIFVRSKTLTYTKPFGLVLLSFDDTINCPIVNKNRWLENYIIAY